MKKDKANERTGLIMVSDHRRPRQHVTPEELKAGSQGRDRHSLEVTTIALDKFKSALNT